MNLIEAKVNDEIVCDNQRFKISKINNVVSITPMSFCSLGDMIITFKTIIQPSSGTNPVAVPTLTTHRYMITTVPSAMLPPTQQTATRGTPYLLLDIDTRMFFGDYVYSNEMSYAQLLVSLSCDRIENHGKFEDLSMVGLIK